MGRLIGRMDQAAQVRYLAMAGRGDEFGAGGAARTASPLDLGRDPAGWQKKVAMLGRLAPAAPRDLYLSAFSLIKGGDLFERQGAPPKTERALLDAFLGRLRMQKTRAAQPEIDRTLTGLSEMLAGSPSLARRMLLARPIELVVVPKGDDPRRYGFPRHTNPDCLGLFWNAPEAEAGLMAIREEAVGPHPYVTHHEMAHAIHFLAFTADERKALDRFLLPTYGYPIYAEEAFAIYAERALGARYAPYEINGGDFYSATRRAWSDRSVFARFMQELLRPGTRKLPTRPAAAWG